MTVVAADVQAMFPDIDTSVDIAWAISDATLIMGAAFTSAKPPVSTPVQDFIVKYLAAHFLSMKIEHGGLLSDRMDQAAQTYVRPAGGGLASTRYGAQAMAFDPTGFLTTVNNQKGVATLTMVNSRTFRQWLPYECYSSWQYI
jgi:hypothetical protein